MELVRGKIYQLEQTHMTMKNKYATLSSSPTIHLPPADPSQIRG